MALRRSYTLIAPIYDLFVGGATRRARCACLQHLGAADGQRVLLSGIGTGLDLPCLPPGPRYVGLDITPAMLARARRRKEAAGVPLHVGDAMALPYADASFDAVVLHLVLAVVRSPAPALAEATRVVKHGGRLLIMDKFLRPGQSAPMRRLLSPLTARIATRMDLVLEELLAARPELTVRHDTPVLAGGWFRCVALDKTG